MQQLIKRVLEFIIALIGLILASPILINRGYLSENKAWITDFISSTTCGIKW